MDAGLFFLFTMSGFVFTMKPGPGYLFEISRILSDRLGTALSIAAGALIGNSVLIWIVFFGARGVQDERILMLVQFLASTLVAVVCGRTLLSAITGNPPSEDDRTIQVRKSWIAFGLIGAVANPINIGFYSSIIPFTLRMEGTTLGTVVVFNAIIVFFLCFARVVYYGLAASFKRVLSQTNIWRSVIIAANGFFILFALTSIVGTVRSLMA